MSSTNTLERVMKKTLLLLPLLLLLVSCTSKKETCAKFAAFQLTTEEAADKLGVQLDGHPVEKFKQVERYCEFHKN